MEALQLTEDRVYSLTHTGRYAQTHTHIFNNFNEMVWVDSLVGGDGRCGLGDSGVLDLLNNFFDLLVLDSIDSLLSGLLLSFLLGGRASSALKRIRLEGRVLTVTYPKEGHDLSNYGGADGVGDGIDDLIHIDSFLGELLLGLETKVPESVEDCSISVLSLLQKIGSGHGLALLGIQSSLSPLGESVHILGLDFLLLGSIGSLLSNSGLDGSGLELVGQLDQEISITEMGQELVASDLSILSGKSGASGLVLNSNLLDPVENIEVDLKVAIHIDFSSEKHTQTELNKPCERRLGAAERSRRQHRHEDQQGPRAPSAVRPDRGSFPT